MKIKNLIFIIAIITLAGVSTQAQDTLKVLFLGNSHTFFSDMPGLFANLSQSGEHPVIVDSNTPGGHTLEGHSNNPTSIDKIRVGIWDYVVLQENSQYPVIHFCRYFSMYPAARYLDSLITAYNGQTAIFMNWGWRYGGQCEVDGHESPIFEDYFHMQDSMTSACAEIADELGAILAPLGEAWRTAVTLDTSLVLWYYDNYHPDLNGSYLNACVFYSIFHDESPVGLPFTGGLSDDEAHFLQQTAWEIITDIDEPAAQLPLSLELHQNYPNPFNASTTIKYSLPNEAEVNLDIYDILGRKVATLYEGNQIAGDHSVSWNAEDVSTGVYFYRLSAGEHQFSRKMLLVK
ncbi:MAG: T9SS type A sorting domain-containing protein [candidate division Zixibacteria bacterium]|nr:T9SS type A sorting domain-containing protein [candidate division Zixibacteria bacterium]